jgi:type IV pilus assembly protein PilV
MQYKLARPCRCLGMTLVESLVALVVLSVGMLGVAGLMLTGISSNRSALYRTQAVNLVTDMADRIRANANARIAYDSLGYGGAPAQRDCAPSFGDAGANCTIAQLAEDDLARWMQSVRTALPGFRGAPARGDVLVIPAGFAGQPDTYRINVRWQEPRERTPYSYQVDLNILPRPPVN